MASDPGVEHHFKRRRFHLHCACGATVTSSGKTAICPDCGGTIKFHRRWWHVRHPSTEENPAAKELFLILCGLLLFALASGLLGLGWAIVFAVVITAGIRGSKTQRSPERAVPNYEKKYLYVGLLILMFSALLALIPVISSNVVRERLALLSSPKPRDCDWDTRPLGDKRCHYEPTFNNVNEPGRDVTVEWRRVID